MLDFYYENDQFLGLTFCILAKCISTKHLHIHKYKRKMATCKLLDNFSAMNPN